MNSYQPGAAQPARAPCHDQLPGDPIVAWLDAAGVIVAVNSAWERFCLDNDGDPARTGVGTSYLAVCDAAGADPGAAEVAAAIRSTLAGELSGPVAVRIGCDSPTESRWFDVLIGSSRHQAGEPGASVTLLALSPAVPPASASGDPATSPIAVDGNDAPELTFPDVPRLELEQVIEQMTARARDVLRAQGRLRALLRANAMIAADLSLPLVLRHIVDAARDLVAARYAALGVVARDATLEQFVHTGMDPATIQRIGALPRGQGLLGHLINYPAPVRVADLSQHPAAVGFPAGHPPMGSFLGVPIRVRNEVFGNLYLTDSRHGEFSLEDEQLVVALAASAGIAIQNARLYEDSERRRRWQAISTETTQLMFTSSQQPLQTVLRQGMKAAGGDLALLGITDDGEVVRIEAAVGALAEQMDVPLRLADSVAAPVLLEGKPVLIEDYSAASKARAAQASAIGSVMIAPLTTAAGRQAALAVGRLAGRPRFSQADLDQLVDFAHHGGIALELDRARADREHLQQLEDHERIAADLHDHVIQELFATGMGLEGMVHALDRADQQNRVLGYVERIDATIRRVRASIFQLSHPERDESSLQQRLLEILEQERPALGFSIHLEFSGPLRLIDIALREDACAVVREALSNIARHAHASSAALLVMVADDLLTIQVTDNGRGIGTPTRSSGLANLRRRAATHHGSLDVSQLAGGGTQLSWTARITK